MRKPCSDPPTLPRRQTLRCLQAALLDWYRQQHRKLPWRAPPGARGNPYHVLVSELMLQQTQVATVVDYFQRFVARWPQVQDLAAAPEQEVLRQWQGLGYYRRARLLHAAAKAVVAQHGGKVPGVLKDLLALPGVGRYTAGAIASIAFGVRAPIVDGNVARVLARWFAIEAPLDAATLRGQVWPLALAVVPEEHPGDFNQAMMELGATVCVPRGPRCLVCPVAKWCAARREGKQEQVPVMPARRAPVAVEHQVVAIRGRGGKYLFVKRPSAGLWANMWGFVTVENLGRVGIAHLSGKGKDEEVGDAHPTVLVAFVAEHLYLAITPPRQVGELFHQTSHRSIRFVVWESRLESGRLPRGVGAWRALDDVDDLPLANPQRRAVALLGTHAGSRQPHSGHLRGAGKPRNG